MEVKSEDIFQVVKVLNAGASMQSVSKQVQIQSMILREDQEKSLK